MLSRIAAGLVLCAASAGLTGCALFQPVHHYTTETLRLFKPSTRDYKDFTEEGFKDEWSSVGEEARGDAAFEQADEPWYHLNFKSAKHRAIERNLRLR